MAQPARSTPRFRMKRLISSGRTPSAANIWRMQLLAVCVWTAMSLAAQDRPQQIMTASADLSWNLTVQITTMLEPPLKSPETQGLEGGVKADGVKVHRYIADKANRTCFGYDLVLLFERHFAEKGIRSPAGNRRHLVSLRPLTIVPQESGFAGGKLQRPIGLSRYPDDQEVEDGDTIVLDVLVSPSGQQKVVDYIRISTKPDPPPGDPTLVPQDFTVDDGPISIKLPFQVFVNGKRFGVGWHIDTGSTMWLGLSGRGMFILSLVPRAGYNFRMAGAIRNHVITFQDGGDQYEIRTSGPIAGSGKAWNLYVLHVPTMEMVQPLFGVDRLGSCTLTELR